MKRRLEQSQAFKELMDESSQKPVEGKERPPALPQIGQAGVGGHLAFVCLERVVSRAEIPRQTLLQLWIDVPNQHRRACIGRRDGRSLLHPRRRENRWWS